MITDLRFLSRRPLDAAYSREAVGFTDGTDGHSPSQPIFDMVDLYSSHVKLIFFYSNYSETAKEETYQRVLGLLSAYGETMDNEDHGKNLIHKLILEGRLSIVEI